MKTLEQTLTRLAKHKKTSVKIGSKGGISFFYCAKLTSGTFEEIDRISKNYLVQLKREYKTKTEIMSNFDTYWENRIAKIRQIEDKKYQNKLIANITLKDKAKRKAAIKAKRKDIEYKLKKLPSVLEKNYKERDKMKVNLPKRIAELEKEISNYTPLLTRVVVEMVDGISPDEPNTKIIYIKGSEIGKYWTIKEYTYDHLPKEKQRTFNVKLPRLEIEKE